MNPSHPAPTTQTGAAYRDCFAQTVDYAARSAVYFGPRTAIVDVERGNGGRFDYVTLNLRATRLARYLAAQGVVKGDRVGLLAQNGVEYIDCLLYTSRCV